MEERKRKLEEIENDFNEIEADFKANYPKTTFVPIFFWGVAAGSFIVMLFSETWSSQFNIALIVMLVGFIGSQFLYLKSVIKLYKDKRARKETNEQD